MACLPHLKMSGIESIVPYSGLNDLIRPPFAQVFGADFMDMDPKDEQEDEQVANKVEQDSPRDKKTGHPPKINRLGPSADAPGVISFIIKFRVQTAKD